jgi:multidrug resistance efflux pump
MSNATDERPAANGELIGRVQQLRLNNQLAATPRAARGGGAGWFPWLLCGIMAALWAAYGIKAYKAPAAPPPAAGTGEPAARPAASATPAASAAGGGAAAPAQGDIVLTLKGNLIPPVQIAVSPIDVGGRVVDLQGKNGKPFQEGLTYKKGDVIARIEDVSYRAQVAEAEAGMAAARRKLEGAKARLAAIMPESVRRIEKDQVEAELREAEAMQGRSEDQVNRLTRIGGSSVSEQELRQARFDLQAAVAKVGRLKATLDILNQGPRKEQIAAATADVNAAEADVRAAAARLVQAQWRLDNCVIKAPIDGVVLTKKAEVGNLVNPMAFSASTSGGGAVCDMANLADLEVELDVPEKDIRNVRPNQLARVRADAYPDRNYVGRLDRIMPIADDSKSVIKVRVKVFLPAGEEPGSFLKPKMSVVVTLLNEDYKPGA